MKTCSGCKVEKNKLDFSKDKYRKDGLCCRCKLCMKKYLQTEAGKESQNRYQRKYRKAFPEKEKAHHVISHAIEAGRLFKQPCPCGETEVEGHHPDYNNPLLVKWLCRKCHNELHRKEI